MNLLLPTTILLLLLPSQSPGHAPATAPDSLAVWLADGQALYGQGRFSEAQAAFEEAVALQPKSALARYWLGMALYRQEQDKAALEQFKRAVKLEWKLAEAHAGIGLVYLRTKNRRFDGRAELETAARLAPASAQIQYYLGLSYIAQNALARTRRFGAYVDGQKYFKRAIDLDPQHPDAYYQLARSYEFPSRECHKAIPLYFQQVLVTPQHHEALEHLGACCFETRRYDEGVAMMDRLAEVQGKNADPMIRTIRLQLTAAAAEAEKDSGGSLAAYDAYLAALAPDERALYTDIRYVAPEAVTGAYAMASDADRAEIWRLFWAARDPDPSTEVNERLIEHYRRVMYARIHFSRGQFPWDRRGDIYVRYGEPDDRQSQILSGRETALYFPTKNPHVDEIRAMNPYRLNIGTGSMSFASEVGFRIESWVYVPYKLELFFADQYGNQTYDYPLSVVDFGAQTGVQPRKLAELLINRMPEAYRYDYGAGPIDVAIDVVTFKEPDHRTLVEVAYGIPLAQLGHAGDGQGPATWLDSRMVLRDAGLHRIAALNEEVGPIERPLSRESQKAGDESRIALLSVAVPPGQYRSALAVRDRTSQRIGIYELSVTVADYNRDSLMVSDIKLSSSVKPTIQSGPFIRHGLEIVPNPGRTYTDARPVYLYYEVYNLNQDDSGRTGYRTELRVTVKEKKRGFFGAIALGIGKLGRLVGQSGDEQSVILTFEEEGDTRDTYRFPTIDTTDLPTGPYVLTLTITDMRSGQSASKSTEFVVK